MNFSALDYAWEYNGNDYCGICYDDVKVEAETKDN